MNAPLTKEGLWRAVLAETELAVSRANFLTWFRKTALVSMHNGMATVSVPNEFSKEWLEAKYRRMLLKLLRSYSEEVRDIAFVIGKEERLHTAPRTQDAFTTPLPLKTPQISRDTNLNPRYNFTSFIVGSFNELAHAASTAIIKQVGTVYNPLFIWGGVGLGKTHLLHAIGNSVVEQQPELKVRYITSEKFTADLVSALRTRTMDSFKERFRSHDVLLIDDVQFLAGKEKSQEELFHTFNDLYANGKQIVFSSDRPPKLIPELEERLRSRFEGGMIADIQIPDLETRMAILTAKSKERGVELSSESCRAIAELIEHNIRELEGALNRVLAEHKGGSQSLSPAHIKKALSGVKELQRKTSFKEIIAVVARYYDLDETVLFEKSRRQEVVKPRQIAMYLVREILRASFPSIGLRFNGRDHTTVMHACSRIAKECSSSGPVADELIAIRAMLQNSVQGGDSQ